MAIKSISISGMGGQQTLAISSTAANTAAITETADYSIWTTTDCYIKIDGPSEAAVTTSNGWILYAGGMPPPITIMKGHIIKAITSSATGTLSYHKIGILR